MSNDMTHELGRLMNEYKSERSWLITRAKNSGINHGGHVNLPIHGCATLGKIYISTTSKGLLSVMFVAHVGERGGFSTKSRNFATATDMEFRAALKNILANAWNHKYGSPELINLIKNA